MFVVCYTLTSLDQSAARVVLACAKAVVYLTLGTSRRQYNVLQSFKYTAFSSQLVILSNPVLSFTKAYNYLKFAYNSIVIGHLHFGTFLVHFHFQNRIL